MFLNFLATEMKQTDQVMQLLIASKREIGVKLHVTDCQPINDGIYSSMNYFIAQVREKFENEIFCNVNLLQLKWCLEEEEGFNGFTLERIEPDLVIIIYPESFDRFEEMKTVSYQLENGIQKYFNTPETRITIGVNCFKIQVYVNEEDLQNAISEWKTNIAPIKYQLNDSERNLHMARHAKLAQKEYCKMIYFLVYLEQLSIQLEKGQIDDKNLSQLLISGVTCIPEIRRLALCLQKYIGNPIDAKGLRCQLVSIILQTLNDLQDIIRNIRKDIITPLFQITPGCETSQQIDKKYTIKNILMKLTKELNDNEIGTVPPISCLEAPFSLQHSIREEHFQKYGWMLGLITSILNILMKIDFDIDEYFQLGCMTHIVSQEDLQLSM
ncbi:unnamed protein product [Heterobilharzia americana]|nr:unnamed protein product [Heterobilharzia americana]